MLLRLDRLCCAVFVLLFELFVRIMNGFWELALERVMGFAKADELLR